VAALPTPDQITALAPDAASLKAGRELAVARKWPLLGADAEALWGLAQGSGKEPYQTRIALSDLATKCSCPSRKFPCKHALGLLFIASGQPGELTDSKRPDWVAEWLAGRVERQEKSKERAEQKASGESAPVDEAAKAKRQEKRATRVDEGVSLLSQWLGDLIRRGFADVDLGAHATWDEIIRRMVDSQAGGLARRLRHASEAARSGSGWEERLADQLGRLHLLLSAYAGRDSATPEMKAEIEQQIGWTVAQEQVLAGPAQADTWLVVARTVSEEDRLVVSNTWLLGTQGGRWAQLVRTSPVVQATVDTLPPGRSYAGNLCFYPGVEPQRALWREEPRLVSAVNAACAAAGAAHGELFASLLARYAAGLALNPWRTRVVVLSEVRLAKVRGGTVLVDHEGAALPVRAEAEKLDLLLAITGGHPALLASLWDGDALEPLSVVDGAEWVPLTRQTLER
jgi:SWIM zinc finger